MLCARSPQSLDPTRLEIIFFVYYSKDSCVYNKSSQTQKYKAAANLILVEKVGSLVCKFKRISVDLILKYNTHMPHQTYQYNYSHYTYKEKKN